MPQIAQSASMRPDDLVEVIRRRVLAGIRSGLLARGDRLPSTRDLSREFSADPRAILAAYRQLAVEGLVEMRPRSGIYLATQTGGSQLVPGLAESWLVEVFAQGIGRDMPAVDLPEWMRRSVETLRMRAAVFAPTADQRVGLCGELRTDYGLEASAMAPDTLLPDDVPVEVRRADLLVATRDQLPRVGPLASSLGKPLVTITVRPDLVSPEWRELLKGPAYVIAVDERFADLVRGYFGGMEGGSNLRTLIVGRDDLSAIPPDAPTYVTRAAREQLGEAEVPGRILPTARTLSPESAREVLGHIIRANVAVLGARGPAG